MLFILVVGLTLFILLIIGYNILDIRKDPYFIRVRKEFYNLEIEYILDVWNMTAKKMSSNNISTSDSRRFSNLIINIIKLAEKFNLEEVISYAICLEEKCIEVQPYKEWSLETLETIIIQSIENKKLNLIQFKKSIDTYIFRIESIFDKYWFDVTQEATETSYFYSKGFPDFDVINRGFEEKAYIKKIWAVSPKLQARNNYYVILTNQGKCYRTSWINCGRYQWKKGCCCFDFISIPGEIIIYEDSINYDPFNLIEVIIRSVKKIQDANYSILDFPEFVSEWETEVWYKSYGVSWFHQYCFDNRLIDINESPLDFKTLSRLSKLINPDIFIESVPLSYSKKIPIINEMLGMYDPDKYNH
jgi:hypothetical protein